MVTYIATYGNVKAKFTTCGKRGSVMVRERGSGKTPDRVVELLSAEVKEKSILAVHKATGIGLAAIGRYLKGIGEPTTATLQRLADYFGVLVPWLQGHFENMPYEAAKKHRKAVDSGQRTGWVGDAEKIQVSVQERVDDLLFMAKAFLALSKSGLLDKDQESRKEHLGLISDLHRNMSALLPLVAGDNETMLSEKLQDLKTVLDRLSG